MRKTISTILVLVMVLSVFTSMGAGATHWAQDAINFVTQNGYWIAQSPIEPDRAATRAETASLFARILISKIPDYNGAYSDVSEDNIYGGDITAVSLMNLMVGYEDEFRPNDTLTREELACILDRAAKMVSDEYVEDAEYNMELYKDGDDVSDWALQSVKNATKRVLMKGMPGKMFAPKGTTTIAEVATVVKTLAEISDVEKEKKQKAATVRDVTAADDVKGSFSVLQTGGISTQMGKGGYGLMARFETAPGDIYVARKTSSQYNSAAAAAPAVVVRVVGPDGNVVARERMDYKTDGIMEKIISIPDGDPGIYRIQFTAGLDNDMCTIGVKDPVSWAVYGDPTFLYTDTTPKKAYFWVPWKFDKMSLGIGGSQQKATIWTEDGLGRVTETPVSASVGARTHVTISTLQPDTVYMLEVSENFNGVIGIRGVSKMLSPTAEMAWDLRGGYEMHTDEYATLQFAGPLQARARERMVEIYNEMGGDFSVDYTAPELRYDYDNVMAEATLHSRGSAGVAGLETALDQQVLDPTSPFFGHFNNVTIAQVKGEAALPKVDWQTGNYATGKGSGIAPSALTINAETNKYYGNKALQMRNELAFLVWVLHMTDSGSFYVSDVADAANLYAYSYENFYMEGTGLPYAYGQVRYFLSPETRAITDDAIMMMSESIMAFRGLGVTNQLFMNVEGALNSYIWSGEEHFYDQFKDNLEAVLYPSTLTNIGQAKLGYWIESGGADGGSYGRMNEGLFYGMVAHYFREIPEEKQDPEFTAYLTAAVDRALKWESLWYAPVVNGFNTQGLQERGLSNISTTRQPSPYAWGSMTQGTFLVQQLFPRAKRNFDLMTMGSDINMPKEDWPYSSDYDMHAALTKNEKGAYELLEYKWPTYARIQRADLPDSYPAASTPTYYTFHEQQEYDNSEIPKLPFEIQEDYYVYDIDGGAIGLKHKGMYMIVYYNNDLGNNISGYSYTPPGPQQIWDEYFANIMSSHKAKSYNLLTSTNLGRNDSRNDYRSKFQESEILHTSIIGTDYTGQFFVEGKGDYAFKWIEEGKSFTISGEDPFSERESIWKYYMTDEGFELEAGFEEVYDADKLWVQLPLIDPSYSVEGSSITYDAENAQVVIAHEDKSITISWDKSVESRFRDDKDTQGAAYRFLQLKLSPTNKMIKIKITRDVGDYVLDIPWYGEEGMNY